MQAIQSIQRILQSAAAELRALPDDELVLLAFKATESPTKALRQEIAAKPARKPRAPRKAPTVRREDRPKRKPKAARAPSTGARSAIVVAANENADRVLVALRASSEPVMASTLAAALKLEVKTVTRGLLLLRKRGVAKIHSGVKRSTRWVPAGRQTGGKPTRAPKASSDEEEGGAPVKLSIGTLPAPPLRRKADARVRAIDTAPTPVVHLPIAIEPVAVSTPADRFRCEPYRAVITAESCLKRQSAEAKQTGQYGSGHIRGGWDQNAVRGDYGKCRECLIGATVRKGLAS